MRRGMSAKSLCCSIPFAAVLLISVFQKEAAEGALLVDLENTIQVFLRHWKPLSEHDIDPYQAAVVKLEEMIDESKILEGRKLVTLVSTANQHEAETCCLATCQTGNDADEQFCSQHGGSITVTEAGIQRKDPLVIMILFSASQESNFGQATVQLMDDLEATMQQWIPKDGTARSVALYVHATLQSRGTFVGFAARRSPGQHTSDEFCSFSAYNGHCWSVGLDGLLFERPDAMGLSKQVIILSLPAQHLSSPPSGRG